MSAVAGTEPGMLFAPARNPDRPRGTERLLLLDPVDGTWRHGAMSDLPDALGPDDLLVTNDAATLPASLAGRTESGSPVELRLAAAHEDGRWTAVLLGAGSWRTPTEHRPRPPRLAAGARLRFTRAPATLDATIEEVSSLSPRLVEIRFDRSGPAFWRALYRIGRPVQYAHLDDEVAIWSAQTSYASRPWAVENPSAGRPLSWSILGLLHARGIRFATLTHAAGLSSTGDPAIDAALPLPERYDLPAATIETIERTRARGGRVVAVGTTVVRALEGCAAKHGQLVPGPDVTDLVIGPGFRPRVVDGLLTGMHDPSSSHARLLQAFAPADLLRPAYADAAIHGYLCHEFGDANLILPAASTMPRHVRG